MIYTHSVGRALQYFPQHTALLRDGQTIAFFELENVYSGEVEAAIYEIPQVKEVAVFGIPDEKWRELVAAVIVRRPGTELSAEEVQQHCKTRIASYKVPRHIEFMTEELPKSGSGKILKRVLREKYWTGQSRRV